MHEGVGPIGIFICKSYKQVNQVANLCRNIVRNVSVPVVEAHGMRFIEEKKYVCNCLRKIRDIHLIEFYTILGSVNCWLWHISNHSCLLISTY